MAQCLSQWTRRKCDTVAHADGDETRGGALPDLPSVRRQRTFGLL